MIFEEDATLTDVRALGYPFFVKKQQFGLGRIPTPSEREGEGGGRKSPPPPVWLPKKRS